MAASQVGLIILVALAIAVPSLLVIRRQFAWQVGERLNQAGQTSQALISEQHQDLENLALLLAQRPTLLTLAEAGDSEALDQYLAQVQSGSGLDLVLLCSDDSQPVAQAGDEADNLACEQSSETGFVVATESGGKAAWLIASQPVQGASVPLQLVAGQKINDTYAQKLREWVGVETALFSGGQLLATSFRQDGENNIELEQSLQALQLEAGIFNNTERFEDQGADYFYFKQDDSERGLDSMFFFPTAEIDSAQQELSRLLGAVMLLVILLGSVIGYFGARQIIRPLERLREAADRLRKGDLATPITPTSRVAELRRVAFALEAARTTLQGSLRQLQQEKAWGQYLLEVVVEGIVTADRRGRITFFSQGAERITGWRADQVLGRDLDDIFPIADEAADFSQSLPPPGGRQKILVRLADGRQATLAVGVASQAPPEASKASTVLLLRDISDEETIRRLLGEFLANIAHEFRTPLSALAASIELLLDELPELKPEELSELLDSVHLGVLSLQTLIDNLLEGASIETGRFRVYPRAVDISDILAEAVQTMEPLANKYGQRIEVEAHDGMPEVQADPRRTVQVLVNLISNAIKWNPSGGTIRLAAAQRDDRIIVSVADQGPGIPAGRQGEVFQRFDHLPAKGKAGESGTGLGLSVVKAIVEAQGGQVGASNRMEGGAEFWFSLVIYLATEATGEVTP